MHPGIGSLFRSATVPEMTPCTVCARSAATKIATTTNSFLFTIFPLIYGVLTWTRAPVQR